MSGNIVCRLTCRSSQIRGNVIKACLNTATQFTIGDTPATGSPFHLAIPVHNLTLAREFYGGILRLKEGRRDDNKWQDYSLYGHQIVCHYVG